MAMAGDDSYDQTHEGNESDKESARPQALLKLDILNQVINYTLYTAFTLQSFLSLKRIDEERRMLFTHLQDMSRRAGYTIKDGLHIYDLRAATIDEATGRPALTKIDPKGIMRQFAKLCFAYYSNDNDPVINGRNATQTNSEAGKDLAMNAVKRTVGAFMSIRNVIWMASITVPIAGQIAIAYAMIGMLKQIPDTLREAAGFTLAISHSPQYKSDVKRLTSPETAMTFGGDKFADLNSAINAAKLSSNNENRKGGRSA
jgi:hypothetical protein